MSVFFIYSHNLHFNQELFITIFFNSGLPATFHLGFSSRSHIHTHTQKNAQKLSRFRTLDFIPIFTY